MVESSFDLHLLFLVHNVTASAKVASCLWALGSTPFSVDTSIGSGSQLFILDHSFIPFISTRDQAAEIQYFLKRKTESFVFSTDFYSNHLPC